MLTAVISDVHANVQALKAVIADAKARGVERFVCLGDIVGYGTSPGEALKLVRETCEIVLAGNHDDAVSGRLPLAEFIPEAKDQILNHRAKLSHEDIKYLTSLPYTYKNYSHADFVAPSKFYYISEPSDAAANFAVRPDQQLFFVGHTHVPELFVTGASGNVYRVEAQDFTLEEGKRYIVSVGSVGYPRATDGHCESSYVIYDDESRAVTYHSVPFQLSSLIATSAQRNYRLRKPMLALGLFAAVSVVVFAVFSRDAGNRSIPESPAMPAFTPSETSVTNRTLAVASPASILRLNLSLSPDSSPARAMMVFKDENGHTQKVEEKLVKRSFAAKVMIPKNTRSVFISIDKVDGEVMIAAFKPEIGL